jgi:lipopolysaccharide export system protein LptC
VALVVLWPMLQDTGTNITLSYKDIESHGEQIRMIGARYAGTDLKNRPFEISADLAVQDRPNAVEVGLSGVKASIDLGAQGRVTVVGREGVYRPEQERLEVKGGIELSADTGYKLSAAAAEVDLKTGQGRGAQAVSGEAPFGSFSANGFAINVYDRTLVLDGGVKVRLDPGELDGQDGPTEASQE